MSDLDKSAVFTQSFLLQAKGGGSKKNLYHISNILVGFYRAEGDGESRSRDERVSNWAVFEGKLK